MKSEFIPSVTITLLEYNTLLKYRQACEEKKTIFPAYGYIRVLSDSDAVIELAKLYARKVEECNIKTNELCELKNKYEKKKSIW